MDGSDLAFAAGLPANAAVAWLRSKGWGVSWDWHDTWEAAHARAFVVAKATRLEILSTLRRAVDKAVAEGQTRREFMRELEPRLRVLGWWGRQTMEMPDGQREVQLGSPRRLKTIYDTNMRVANNAARFRAQHRNVEARPFWQYLSMEDDRVRPSHRAMSRRVFRADDAIWNTHYRTPLGYCTRTFLLPHGAGTAAEIFVDRTTVDRVVAESTAVARACSADAAYAVYAVSGASRRLLYIREPRDAADARVPKIACLGRQAHRPR